MFSRVITFLIGTAALAAVVISFNLTVKHITGSSGVGWFDAGCSNESGPGKMNCAKVLSSPYGYFPPKFPDKPDQLPHFPVSFLGLLYYSALLVWLIGVGRPSFSRRWIHLFPLLLVSLGLVVSAFSIFVMYRVIAEWCLWCLVTHGLNLLIAIGLIALWPRRKPENVVQAVEGAPSDHATAAMIPVPHPTNRLVFTTLMAILFLSYGHLFFFEWRDLKKDANHMQAELNQLRTNVGGFIAQWQLASPCALTARPDDPVYVFNDAPQADPLLDVVVFSDFECPACGRFAEFFEKQVPPLFGNRIRMAFRHFPLDQACNPRSTKTIHAHACSSAFLAEGARLLGGSESFWKAHNYLFKNHGVLAAGAMTADRLAAAVGLNATDLQSAAKPAEHMARIARDAEQAGICGIRGTPSVFVDGRRIETTAATNIEFWDKVADWYWLEKARTERPTSTRLPPTAAPHPQG